MTKVSRRAVGLALGLSVSVIHPAGADAKDAHPPLSYRVDVERAEGAAECPDAKGLSERLAPLHGSEIVRIDGGDPDVVVSVRLSKASGEYTAVIRALGKRTGERTLTAKVTADRCAPFAQTVAVAIAILIDPIPVVIEPPPPPPPIRTIRKRRDPPKPQPAPPQRWRSIYPRFGFEVWGLQSGALLNTGAFGLSGMLDARVNRWFSVAGGVFWLPEDRAYFGSGRVDLTLVSGLLEACITPVEVHHFRAWVCGTGALGALTGVGHGFDADVAATLTWGALGGSIAAETDLIGPLSLVSRVTLLVPVQQRAFVVVPASTNVEAPTGDAFRTRPAGVLAGFGLRLTVP